MLYMERRKKNKNKKVCLAFFIYLLSFNLGGGKCMSFFVFIRSSVSVADEVGVFSSVVP